MSTNYVTARPAGREHFPLYPNGFIVARILQLVLAVICLGLNAYLVAVLPISGAALMVFTSIIALVSGVYILVTHFRQPVAYNYWAVLGLDIFHVVFWLIAFAVLASQASYLVYYFYGYNTATSAYGATAAAAAGLGAIEWLVYVVTLILHSIALHRHRKAGLHAMPSKTDSSAPVPGETAAAGVPDGAEKYQMQPQKPQQPQEPQPQEYGQPPQTYYPPPVNTPPPQIYSPSPPTTVSSPVYTQPTPPPQQIYEAPYAGIEPAEKIHEAPEAGR